MERLSMIDSLGISSYANWKTVEIAKAKGLPVPKRGFTDPVDVMLGDRKMECYYHGPAHWLGNIVVWKRASGARERIGVQVMQRDTLHSVPACQGS